jgi:hypothetical protein
MFCDTGAGFFTAVGLRRDSAGQDKRNNFEERPE